MYSVIAGIILGIAGFVAGQEDDKSVLSTVVYLAIGMLVAPALTVIQFAIKNRG